MPWELQTLNEHTNFDSMFFNYESPQDINVEGAFLSELINKKDSLEYNVSGKYCQILFKTYEKLPEYGWKIHISSNIINSKDIFNLVSKYLIKEEINSWIIHIVSINSD